MLSEPTAVTLKVIDALDSLGIPYLIGGSFASAIHGIARMTADTDMIADIRLNQAGELAAALEGRQNTSMSHICANGLLRSVLGTCSSVP